MKVKILQIKWGIICLCQAQEQQTMTQKLMQKIKSSIVPLQKLDEVEA